MKEKLYFVTYIGVDYKYKYIYLLAFSKNEAKSYFCCNYSFKELISIRALYPTKRNLNKIYESLANKKW